MQTSGKYTFSNGNVYNGKFDEKGIMADDKATIDFEEGKYEGEVKNGKMDGKGKLTWTELERVKVEEIKKKGETDKDFKERVEEAQQQEGETDEDFKARVQEAHRKAWEEEGLQDRKYLDGQPMFRMHKSDEEEDKDGYVYYTRQKFYEGDFQEGFRTGKGKILLPDGREYEGDFNLGCYMNPDPLQDNGEGVMKWEADADGSVKTYEGQFYYYLPDGIGTETIVYETGK